MKLLAFLILCFLISFQPILSFLSKKQNLFSNKIAQKDYRYKNQEITVLNHGKTLLIKKDRDPTHYIDEYHLYANYTSSKSVYTNIEGIFMGIVVLDKLLYHTTPAPTIFQIDFSHISVFGSEKIPDL